MEKITKVNYDRRVGNEEENDSKNMELEPMQINGEQSMGSNYKSKQHNVQSSVNNYNEDLAKDSGQSEKTLEEALKKATNNQELVNLINGVAMNSAKIGSN